MRVVKIILGVAYLLSALILGGIMLLFFSYVGWTPILTDIGITFVTVIFTLGLVASGLFLIAKRSSPMSKKAMVLVAFALILPMLVGMPAFVRARTTSASNACINNLRQIDAAMQQWALENNATTNSHPTWHDIRPYLGRGTQGEALPHCPQGGTYIIGRIDEKPRCSLGGRSHSIE